MVYLTDLCGVLLAQIPADTYGAMIRSVVPFALFLLLDVIIESYLNFREISFVRNWWFSCAYILNAVFYSCWRSWVISAGMKESILSGDIEIVFQIIGFCVVFIVLWVLCVRAGLLCIFSQRIGTGTPLLLLRASAVIPLICLLVFSFVNGNGLIGDGGVIKLISVTHSEFW